MPDPDEIRNAGDPIGIEGPADTSLDLPPMMPATPPAVVSSPISTASMAVSPTANGSEAFPAGRSSAIAPRRTILKNFVGIVSVGLVGRFAGLALDVYVRRTLQPQAVGVIDWNGAALSYASTIANPGLQTVARRDAAKNPARVAELFLRIGILQSLPLILILLGCVACQLLGLRPGLAGWLLVIQATTGLLAAVELRWAFEAVDRYVIVNLFGVISLLLTMACTMLLVRSPGDSVQLVLINLFGNVVLDGLTVCTAIRAGLLNYRDLKAATAVVWQKLPKLYCEGLPLTLATLSVILYSNGVTLVLGPTHGNKAVGLFSTAYGLMMLGTVPAGTLQNIYFASFSRAIAVKDGEAAVAAVAFDYFRAVFLAVVPAGLLGWSIGRHVLRLMYGPAYDAVGPYFEWLCLYLVFVAFSIGLAGPLVPWGKNALYFRITALGAVVNLSLNFILVPRYAVAGGVATAVVAEAAIAVAILYVRRSLVPIPLTSTFCSLALMSGVAWTARAVAARRPNDWVVIGLLTAAAFVWILLVFNPPLRARLIKMSSAFRMNRRAG